MDLLVEPIEIPEHADIAVMRRLGDAFIRLNEVETGLLSEGQTPPNLLRDLRCARFSVGVLLYSQMLADDPELQRTR